MKKTYDFLSEKIDGLVRRAVIVLFALLLLDVWFAILDRYVFRLQIVWTEELARYLMVWTMFLAIVSGIYRRQHVAITFLADKLSGRSKSTLQLIINLISMMSCIGIGVFAVPFAIAASDVMTNVFNIPMTVPYLAIAVSFFIGGVQYLLLILSDCSGTNKGTS